MGGKEAVIELLRDLIVGLEHRVRALEEDGLHQPLSAGGGGMSEPTQDELLEILKGRLQHLEAQAHMASSAAERGEIEEVHDRLSEAMMQLHASLTALWLRRFKTPDGERR